MKTRKLILLIACLSFAPGDFAKASGGPVGQLLGDTCGFGILGALAIRLASLPPTRFKPRLINWAAGIGAVAFGACIVKSSGLSIDENSPEFRDLLRLLEIERGSAAAEDLRSALNTDETPDAVLQRFAPNLENRSQALQTLRTVKNYTPRESGPRETASTPEQQQRAN